MPPSPSRVGTRFLSRTGAVRSRPESETRARLSDSLVSTAWIEPGGKLHILPPRFKSHADFAQHWLKQNDLTLFTFLSGDTAYARPHASIWERALVQAGWIKYSNFREAIVPRNPTGASLHTMADLMAESLANQALDPERLSATFWTLTSHAMEPIRHDEDHFPWEPGEVVNLARFLQRYASREAMDDLYSALGLD